MEREDNAAKRGDDGIRGQEQRVESMVIYTEKHKAKGERKQTVRNRVRGLTIH